MSSHTLEGVVNASFKQHLQNHSTVEAGVHATKVSWSALHCLSTNELPHTALPKAPADTSYERHAEAAVFLLVEKLTDMVHGVVHATADQMPEIVSIVKQGRICVEQLRMPALDCVFPPTVRCIFGIFSYAVLLCLDIFCLF
jgi:hypothetical protein